MKPIPLYQWHKLTNKQKNAACVFAKKYGVSVQFAGKFLGYFFALETSKMSPGTFEEYTRIKVPPIN